VSASTRFLINPCISPFSTARATLLIGRFPTRMRLRTERLGFRDTGTAERRVQVKGFVYLISAPKKLADRRRASSQMTRSTKPIPNRQGGLHFVSELRIPFLCVRRTEFEIVGVELAPSYRSNTPVPARP
jgi:hypothetical protein